MKTTGKTISVMASLQFGAVFFCYLGSRLGVSIVQKLYGPSEMGPGMTRLFASWGLWPMVVPLIWTATVLARFHQDAPDWEMVLWFFFAATFFVIIGGGGLISALAPLVTCNFTR